MKRRKYFRTGKPLLDLEQLKLQTRDRDMESISIKNISYNGMALTSNSHSFNSMEKGAVTSFFLEHRKFRVAAKAKIIYTTERLMGLKFLNLCGDVSSFYEFMDLPLLQNRNNRSEPAVSSRRKYNFSILNGYSLFPALSLTAVLFLVFLFVYFRVWQFFF